MSKCILVLGLPRSGTSMIAGILHHLGVFMGNQLTPADKRNPNGFFENLHFINFHARATSTMTFTDIVNTWKRVQNGETFPLNKDVDEARRSAVRESYKAIISITAQGHEYWGIKDPRLIIPNLLDDFFVFAEGIVDDVRIIYIKRNSESIAKSLLSVTDKKYTLDELREIVVWTQDHIKKRLTNLNVPRMYFEYERVLKEKEKHVNRIMHFCKIDEYSRMQNAVDFIDPNLRKY